MRAIHFGGDNTDPSGWQDFAPTDWVADQTPDYTIEAKDNTAGSREYDSRWDVSGDGSVTSLDALMILQAAAGAVDL